MNKDETTYDHGVVVHDQQIYVVWNKFDQSIEVSMRWLLLNGNKTDE